MSEEQQRPKTHMTAAMVAQRSETMGQIRFMMDYARKTARSAIIPPAPNGMPAQTFALSVEYGIVWVPDQEAKGRLVIKQPFDLWRDHLGAAYIVQWEGPVGP